MALKNPGNRDLPPRMLRRTRKRKNGRIWVSYYYDGRDENGKRKEIPLGPDLYEAKVQWAKLEYKNPPKIVRNMGEVFDRYEVRIIPGKKPRTQQDNLKELKQLRKAFENAPIDAITPQVVAQYRDARTAKIRANREIALLSHVFTIAREWGMTEKANPCAGVRRNKETPRDFYADSAVWDAVYAQAAQELKDAMQLAYLTGQRPADVLKISIHDLTDDFLLVGQGKTLKRLRILLRYEGMDTKLSIFIEDLMKRRVLNGIRNSRLVTNTGGLRMSAQMLRNRWDEARLKAEKQAATDNNPELAARIRQFQFRDIRPKAASEIGFEHASRLLGHSKEDITRKVYRRIGEVVRPTE
uniref:phage integrase n=1 Tax=Pseudomonas lundensis TaxID=86185 RepID=UPI0028D0E2B8|nr:tyrosine-type recombinase/integrase [Pseudomonas lundensis]